MFYDEINEVYRCDVCSKEVEFSEDYDAYFCSSCDTWAEEKCDDESCLNCVGRPDKPSQAK